MKLYPYVGPRAILGRIPTEPAGMAILSVENVRRWLNESRQVPIGGTVVVTFTVDGAGLLRVADRRSEHVACAGGGRVQSAGEMTFEVVAGMGVLGVAEVSNQSTGYCPEPESWPAVANALSRAGLPHPRGFTLACVFRRCPSCGQLGMVRDEVFECAVCGSPLPWEYNVEPS